MDTKDASSCLPLQTDFNTLEQLFRYLVTFKLFLINLKAVLIMLKHLYMYLGSIPSFLSNLRADLK